jgi:hypothetical protein
LDTAKDQPATGKSSRTSAKKRKLEDDSMEGPPQKLIKTDQAKKSRRKLGEEPVEEQPKVGIPVSP